ncbi:zinc finger protein 512 isoform X3 [Erinaceus europaeus]|uniref:Zinc finger protein 512 n=1 Tax=Erinaceus europaeus TaxID=9365 RepID=A0ABM3X1P0_ERIEU|nr:zinc finger protein 512 isoform X3 [Erinaceus europaeus]
MTSRLGAVPATPGPTAFKQQRSSRIVGAKNSRTQCSIKDNSFQYTDPHDDSLSGSSSASSCEPASDFPASLQKSTCWMKMRRVKPAAASPVEGGVSAKGKRKPRQEEDEDYREFPQKKHRLYGRKQRPKTQPNPKPQTRRIRKEPPSYAAGSLEEQWYLEIVDKGSVSCPTCQTVGRKTIEGLKKHMENCKQEMFTCHHCGKQLRSVAGMKYHVMANHNSLPILKTGDEIDEPSERERLRTVLKRLGKLRCMRESCSSSFTSIMGYMYHVRKCGKGAAELEKLALKCQHCGKPYRSKAGLSYHLRSEHAPISLFPESGQPECLKEMSLEPKCGGRVQRRSAKIAVYHLQELASAELAKDWPKRKVLQDLVPDDRKLKYTRPGLPTFSQELLHKWKLDVKKYHRIQCPNEGNFVAGKYKCLLCQKEFVSESGVKYHINSVHAEDWFIVNPTTTKSFEKLMKIKERQQEEEKRRQQHRSRRSLRRRQQASVELPEAELSLKVGKDQRRNNEELLVSASCKEAEQEPVPAQLQKGRPPKTNQKRGRK